MLFKKFKKIFTIRFLTHPLPLTVNRNIAACSCYCLTFEMPSGSLTFVVNMSFSYLIWITASEDHSVDMFCMAIIFIIIIDHYNHLHHHLRNVDCL